MEPQKFAAELIHRLEAVQRTREAEEKLEERLKRVRMVSAPPGRATAHLQRLVELRMASGPHRAPSRVSQCASS